MTEPKLTIMRIHHSLQLSYKQAYLNKVVLMFETNEHMNNGPLILDSDSQQKTKKIEAS